MRVRNINYFTNIIKTQKPRAKAEISGGPIARSINGTVSFYKARNGALVVAEIYNLPDTVAPAAGKPGINPFGFHIHEGETCKVGQVNDPFKDALGHYNPTNAPHPLHAGDMPVLFANNGYAFLVFYTNRFTPEQVIGRTVIIHENPDDYKSQPSGAAGKRLACGIIRKV